MITKEADTLYCGVNEKKIKSANPVLNEEVLRYHHLFLTERHEIYKRKEILKLPQEEWTNDEVLKNYRFTNIRRELDRESKWLIERVSTNDELTLENKILNTILFRTYNKSTTLDLFDYPIKDFENIDIDRYRNIFLEYGKQNPKYVFFTPAFNTGGLKSANAFPSKLASGGRGSLVDVITDGVVQKMGYSDAREYVSNNKGSIIDGWEPNMPTRMIYLVKYLHEIGLHKELIEQPTQEHAYQKLLEVPGFSGFLAYQVFVDLTYIPEYKFSENEFTISGPGCNRGLDLLFDDRDGMNYEEALFWVRDNIANEWEKRGLEFDFDKLLDHLEPFDRCLNVMMCENSFCELQKIVSAKRGTGRPRNKYNPTEPSNVVEKNGCSVDEWMVRV